MPASRPSRAAEHAHAYSRNKLLVETEWCGSVANALTAWAGCGYEDRI